MLDFVKAFFGQTLTSTATRRFDPVAKERLIDACLEAGFSAAKLALNTTLGTYVEQRLAGVVMTPSGAAAAGPAVPWKGRRHGPRKDRRWARAWSPEQIARRLPIDFPDDKDDLHQPRSHLSSRDVTLCPYTR
ncbi:hypothetical protein MesoLjLa_68900 (plasmid) [Mesorhizobium sp. L-2-11]|nr:hypothetical protein MesoLjLa_68900 [Mesorhizobium sp. L-2-11]